MLASGGISYPYSIPQLNCLLDFMVRITVMVRNGAGTDPKRKKKTKVMGELVFAERKKKTLDASKEEKLVDPNCSPFPSRCISLK